MTNFMPPLVLNINVITRESRIGHPRESNWSPPDWLPMITTIIISSATTEKVPETSPKLCICPQVSHPSTRVSSTFCRWHMLRFDTSYKGGKPFLPILKLLGLTCATCCNEQFFLPESVMFRDFLFPCKLLFGIIISHRCKQDNLFIIMKKYYHNFSIKVILR